MSRFLWNPNIYCRVHKSRPPPVSVLSQINPIHNTEGCIPKFRLISSSHLRSGLHGVLFLSNFPPTILPPLDATRPANPSDHPDSITLTTRSEVRRSRLHLLCNFFRRSVDPSSRVQKYVISNTFNPGSSLNADRPILTSIQKCLRVRQQKAINSGC